jgi:hypothetical protein
MEFHFACCTIGFGFFLLLPAVSMDSPAFIILLVWLREFEWAFLFVMTGAAHLASLLVNGMRWWTPFTRTFMLVINTLCYSVFAYGFWTLDPYSTAVYTYGVFVGAEALICIYRAVVDCVHAITIRTSYVR